MSANNIYAINAKSTKFGFIIQTTRWTDDGNLVTEVTLRRGNQLAQSKYLREFLAEVANTGLVPSQHYKNEKCFGSKYALC